MALGKDQISFIRKKVMELGSAEAVKKFYCYDDKVCAFANTFAKRVKFPKKRRKLRKREG